MINPKEKMLDQMKSAADETDIVAVAMAFGEEIQKHGDPAMAIFALRQQLAEAKDEADTWKNIARQINTHWIPANERLAKQLAEAQRDAARYNELLYAVAKKHPDETRHETALRYIRQAEQPKDDQCQAMKKGE